MQATEQRRRRRAHSVEFKAQVLAQCAQPGASIAAVALANGVNANLVRKWLVGERLAEPS
jgi:transposase